MNDTLALAELRNLRRYAYCILGNRNLGDMAVEKALNTLVVDVITVSGSAISRLDLYRKVNEAANAGPGNVSAAAASGFYADFHRLSRPASPDRCAAVHCRASARRHRRDHGHLGKGRAPILLGGVSCPT